MDARNNDELLLTLTQNEALVLYDWLVRFNESEEKQFDDRCEQRLLHDLEAVLEKNLTTVFSKDYAVLLDHARSMVRDTEAE